MIRASFSHCMQADKNPFDGQIQHRFGRCSGSSANVMGCRSGQIASAKWICLETLPGKGGRAALSFVTRTHPSRIPSRRCNLSCRVPRTPPGAFNIPFRCNFFRAIPFGVRRTVGNPWLAHLGSMPGKERLLVGDLVSQVTLH